MNPERPRADEVFAAALEIADPAARSAYLDRACGGDAALRREVESLLSAHARGGNFLETGTMAETLPALSPTEQRGQRIGRYRLLEQIGEGGFGAVWMTEQEEPVRRRVALKVIKLGMDTREVVARFEAERQALAMMDHPSIARVFDGGATDAGRPFFVMELVRGVPITRYCDDAALDTAERLRLFIQVCEAVQHAHQKGVIHRDLKPTNILVTELDGRAIPKVIDFGVAKATLQRLTEKTLFTRLGQMVGTPAYMSPEQAGLGGLDIDTRSDVYSLGVVLYELLTGRTPFDTKSLLAAGYEAILKTLREVDPLKPSTRLSTLTDEELRSVAQRRNVEPGKLGRTVRGDLDWIVMKALEKDRGRRYGTANGMAMDLRRHLNLEEVSARPPSNLYRLRKAMRRHRAVFGSVAAVVLALVLGAVVAAWQALRATRFAETAITNERIATNEMARASRLAVSANEARVAAEESALQALNSAAFLQEDLGRRIEALPWLASAVESARRNPDHRIESVLRMRNWLEATPHPIAAFRASSNQVLEVVFHPGGGYLAANSLGPHAAIHDLEADRPLSLGGDTTAVAWDSSGLLLAAGASSGTVRVVDFPKLTERFRVQAPGPITSVQFSPAGAWLAVGASNSVRLVDVAAGRLVAWKIENPGRALVLTFSPSGKHLAAQWDQDQMAVIRLDPTVHPPAALACALDHASGLDSAGVGLLRPIFLADEARILVCIQRILFIRDIATGQAVKQRTLSGDVSALRLSPDRATVIVARFEGCQAVDATSLEDVGKLMTHGNSPKAIDFTPDGTTMLAGGWDSKIVRWTLEDGTGTTLRVEQGNLTSIRCSPDGWWVAAGKSDGHVRVWEMGESATDRRWIRSHRFSRPRFSEDGGALYSAGSSYRNNSAGSIQLFNPGTGMPLGPVIEGRGVVLDAALRPDGRTVILATSGVGARPYSAAFMSLARQLTMFGRDSHVNQPGQLQFLDPKTAQPLGESMDLPAEPRSVLFRPQRGDRAAVLCANGQVILFDPETREVKRSTSPSIRRGHNHYTNNGLLRSSPDGSWLVAFGLDNRVAVLDWETGDERFPPLRLDDLCHDIALLPSEDILATAGFDRQVRFWDLKSGEPASQGALVHPDWVFQLAFSPDGASLATAGRDHAARLWDWRRGALRHQLAHDDEVKGVAFVDEGRAIVTMSYDRSFRLWGTKTGRPLTPRMPLPNQGWEVCVAPKGATIAFGGDFNGMIAFDASRALGASDAELTDDWTLAAEVVSTRRLLSSGGIYLDSPDEWLTVWRRFRKDGGPGRRAKPAEARRSWQEAQLWRLPRTNAFDHAFWHYSRLTRLDPGNPSWELGLADALLGRGRPVEALAALAEDTAAFREDGLTLRTLRATAWAAQSNWSGAVGECDAALARYPGHAAALLFRGHFNGYRQNWAAAEADLANALRSYPFDLHTVHALAVAQLHQGRTQPWRDLCGLMANRFEGFVHPSMVMALMWPLGLGPAALKDFEPVLADMTESANNAPPPGFGHLQGAILFRAGRLEEARAILEKAEALDEPSTLRRLRLLFLAMLSARLGDATQAKTFLDQADRAELRPRGDLTHIERLMDPEWLVLGSLNLLRTEAGELIATP